MQGREIQKQFKELARMLKTIEDTVADAPKYGLPGIPVKSVELLCERMRVTPLGVEFLTCMITQSDRVALSECRQWLVKKEVIIDVN